MASADKSESQFQGRLRQGGQRMRVMGRAEIYQRNGGKLDRVTDQGAHVKARPIMSNRIRINDHLRGIGNVYGASVEQIELGFSGEFLPEIVDGGQKSAGGITPHLVAIRQRVRIAQEGLAGLSSIQHKANSKAECGAHNPISHRFIIDHVCVAGADLAEIALRMGWYVIKDEKRSIPKQQSQKLKAALIDGLEAIESAWSEAEIDVTYMIDGVEVG